MQLAEIIGTSWLLWRLSAWCYRPRVPRDLRDVSRWPVELAEPPAQSGQPVAPPREAR